MRNYRKHLSRCYRVINGILFLQWADVGTLQEAQELKKYDEQHHFDKSKKFVIRKISDGYRVYISQSNTPVSIHA